MVVARSAAIIVSNVVFFGALGTLAVWMLWYGQYQWGIQLDCKTYRPAFPGGAPAAWVMNTACALNWQRSVQQANVGFLYFVPAVAALAAIVVIGLRDHHHKPHTGGSTKAAELIATLQSWSCTQLPPKRFWLWFCDGLTVKDALLVVAWAAFNAVWYSTILSKAFALVPPCCRSPRLYAKGFASLMMPNLVVLFFPVSRGSVINNALGVSYPEGIRYHRWLGQWVLLLISLHGLIYWISWAADGRWLISALNRGPDTNNLMGGVALVFALLLWATSQERVRRWSYALYKPLHHIGFWGFLLMGCAHHWALFWYFVPGMLLYAVDGVFRLHQAFAGRSGELTTTTIKRSQLASSTQPAAGCSGVNTEVLAADVDPARSMCSLLLAAPEFGAAPAGIVWLNVPAISLTQWHAFDYTGSTVAVSADGEVCNGYNSGKGNGGGSRQVTALSVHIKAYSRWTRTLVDKLAEGSPLTIRLQGPYADPPTPLGQPDAVVLVAGGNGIASALPVFEELAAAGVRTQGLPALLIWASRKGHEFKFMAPKVLAAAHALGLNLTVRLNITDGAEICSDKSLCKSDSAFSTTRSDVIAMKDSKDVAVVYNSDGPNLAYVSSAASSSSGDLTAVTSRMKDAEDAAGAAAEGTQPQGAAASAPTSLCPVVALASFAGQLTFKAVMHLAVFAGFLLGLFITTYVAATLPAAAGQRPWHTIHLGPALVLITAGGAVAMGLVTLWIGLLIQRRSSAGLLGPVVTAAATGPAAAIAAATGKLAHLVPAAAVAGPEGGKDGAGRPSLMLEVPCVTAGTQETLPVIAQRPAVGQLMQGWLASQQQLPAAKSSGKLHCVVFGCGPTPLDHATQLAVADIAAKQKRHNSRGGAAGASRPMLLQFVRKAQQL